MKKGQKMPEELRLKLIGNKRGVGAKHIVSEETKLKISVARKGKSSVKKGSKLPIEWRRNLSKSRKGYKYSHEELEKNRQGQYKRYLKINPDYKVATRNERIAKNGGFHSQNEWENLKAQYNWTCPCCKKQKPEIKLTKDHIISLLRGGSNNIENIQPLCKICNCKKHSQSIKY